MLIVQGRKRRGVRKEPVAAHDTSGISYASQRNLYSNNEGDRRRREIHKEIQLCRRWDDLLSNNNTSISQIKQLLINDGIPNNSIRRRVWMILLHINRDEIPRSFKDAIHQCDGFNPSHKYVPIVFRDVERSLWTWVPDPAQRSVWRNHLLNLINAVLNKHHTTMHYYQGYHDIASAVLLSCGVEDGLAFLILERLSLNHLRDFMAPQLSETAAQLNLLVPLLKMIESNENDRPESVVSAVEAIEESAAPTFFALSWVLTWASHVIPNVSLATYVVDVMLGHHPALPVYLSAAIVIESRQHGLAALPRPYQMPQIHQYFGTFPVAKANLISWPRLMQQAVKFMNDFPPALLLQEHAAAAQILPTSTLFKYPFDYMKQDEQEERGEASKFQFSFRSLSAAKKTIGFVSVTSIAAAITAYVYVSSFTGT